MNIGHAPKHVAKNFKRTLPQMLHNPARMTARRQPVATQNAINAIHNPCEYLLKPWNYDISNVNCFQMSSVRAHLSLHKPTFNLPQHNVQQQQFDPQVRCDKSIVLESCDCAGCLATSPVTIETSRLKFTLSNITARPGPLRLTLADKHYITKPLKRQNTGPIELSILR